MEILNAEEIEQKWRKSKRIRKKSTDLVLGKYKTNNNRE